MLFPSAGATSSNTILVMTSSTRTCSLLTEFLSTMDPEASPGSRGRQMMMKKLRLYLWWKGKLSQRKQEGNTSFAMPGTNKHNRDNKDEREKPAAHHDEPRGVMIKFSW